MPFNVDGHAYMANPVSRGILWSTTPHGMGAFGPGSVIENCGQSSNGNGFKNEMTHANQNANVHDSTRDCISTLKIGSIFRVHVRIKAHHTGVMEVRLCNRRLASATADLSDCPLLERAASSDVPSVNCANHDAYGPHDICTPKDTTQLGLWYMTPCKDVGNVHGAGAMTKWCDKYMYFKVPASSPPGQATLQWYWKTANSCMPGPQPNGVPSHICQEVHRLSAAYKMLPGSDFCSGQWACHNCLTNPANPPNNCYDFSGKGKADRTCCGEVFTNCADVLLSTSKGNTAGPAGQKNAFEGDATKIARTCTNPLLNVVYSDETPDEAASNSGGAGAATCPNGIRCYVAAWSDPCHQWATTEATCRDAGGTWLPLAGAAPTPATTKAPAPATAAPATSAAPATTKAPTPVTAAPATGGCIAIVGNSQGATDAHCAPCATGQTWWPCGKTLGVCTGSCGSTLLQESEPEPEPEKFDASQCISWTSNSDRAPDTWCLANCYHNKVLHVACDPKTEEAHRFCGCVVGTPSSLGLAQEVAATKFSGSIAAKVKKHEQALIDAVGRLDFDVVDSTD